VDIIKSVNLIQNPVTRKIEYELSSKKSTFIGITEAIQFQRKL